MSTDLTPEHSARPFDSDKFSEVEAAFRYVDGMARHADIPVRGWHGTPAWHGWALREAFPAGCSYHAASNQYIVQTAAEAASENSPSKSLVEFLRESPALVRRIDEIEARAFKAGSVAALKSLEISLQRKWAPRIGFRLAPGFLLKKFRVKIEEMPPLPVNRGSESPLCEFEDSEMPLG
jgi:hypothetical protein